MIGVFKVSAQESSSLEVIKQTTSYFETNTYLIYDSVSKDAALVDAGSQIDSLLSVIREKDLNLRYVFITHCHPDHVSGVVDVKKKYPQVQVCFSKEEYEDMLNVYTNWENLYSDHVVKVIKSNAEAFQITNMDYKAMDEPDVWVADNNTFYLGNHQIKTIHTPGHARGSISYTTENILFSGDELYYLGVGNTDRYPTSSFENQITSVRKLYTTLNPQTIVFPGHGPKTTIASEIENNEYITLTKAEQ